MTGDRHRDEGEVVSLGRTGAFSYMSGFENSFATEAVEGALPIGRNSPQNAPLGLYAEQISGSAFTAPRHTNRRTWFYRIRPSVAHARSFAATSVGAAWLRTAPSQDRVPESIGQMRWRPIDVPEESCDFLEGIRTITTCGDASLQSGMAVHVYVANRSMNRRYMYDADGEILVVPQQGAIHLFTECGRLEVAPGEIAVIPRGMKFKVDLADDWARGYLCENYGAYFTLPERGPIGANCLANARDFLTPVAAFEDHDEPCELFVKTLGKLYVSASRGSPLDVVGWHGNHAPYKFDLARFSPVGSVRADHPDPSIYTVLTSASDRPGTANVDFVIFPDRWLVMEDTFRPPWFHMNFMSEFMGLIYGVYDAKPDGFVPGGMSLHNPMIPHGPSDEAFAKASSRSLIPERLSGTLAFMFETRFVQQPTAFAASREIADVEYPDCWAGLDRRFGRS